MDVDPDNGLKDGDVVKEIDSNGNPTGKSIVGYESTDIKYTLVPVKKDGSNWVYESANAASKAGGYGLSDPNFLPEKLDQSLLVQQYFG